ncbi:hypothetical protein [Hymenobacter siberiensis]|jgi:predicted Fe-S protein YdhL (DUF1289 family)|uniref:hypothetical protein n=1 Tax=Hymenobacter siberiensis TaxID=2848396 RepID=UPI001C1E4FD8|nr:hypothetical protein [Hymenobacter siberiensis]
MLRLDKTVSRKVPLHYNEEAESRARWQAMSFTEKREVVLVLQQRRDTLHALSEQGREQDQHKATGEPTN